MRIFTAPATPLGRLFGAANVAHSLGPFSVDIGRSEFIAAAVRGVLVMLPVRVDGPRFREELTA